MDRRVDLNDKFKLSFLSVPHLLQDCPVGVPHTLQQPELAQVQLLVRTLVVVVVSAALYCYCCSIVLLLYCYCCTIELPLYCYCCTVIVLLYCSLRTRWRDGSARRWGR